MAKIPKAKLGLNPSFVWRSILWGRQLLHEGLKWRVGNGNQISIFSSNWMKKVELLTSIPLSNLSTRVGKKV